MSAPYTTVIDDPATDKLIVVTFPECPTCHSRTKKCKRPSGHDASHWHADRVELWDAAVEAAREAAAKGTA